MIDDAPTGAVLARDAGRRLRLALRRWAALDLDPPPVAAFAGIDPVSGRFRAWLADVEDWLAVAAEASRSHVRRSTLVDRVADAGFLADAAPGGRIPRDFPHRVRREAGRRLEASARRIHGLHADGLEIGALLVERGSGRTPNARVRAFERRVERALALLDRAWPEGAHLVRERVWRVVPIAAVATVSFSSAREPGIAYIAVTSAPDLRTAEDLVHEATHMRLHEIEAIHPLVARRARGAGGEEPRFYSPWRREWRPLRGLVHAVATFTAGAIFFERMLSLPAREIPASRRRWLAGRLLEERASVAIALRALRAAGKQGMLAEAGRRLVAAASKEHASLAAAARRREGWLRRSADGRAELARVKGRISRLRERPMRWRWAS